MIKAKVVSQAMPQMTMPKMYELYQAQTVKDIEGKEYNH